MSKFNYKDDITWRDIVLRSAIILVSVALITWFMPDNTDNSYHAEKGKPWRYATFTAPYDFPVYKSAELLAYEQDSAMSAYEPYYTLDESVGKAQIARFKEAYAQGIPGLDISMTNIIANRLDALYAQGIMAMAEHNAMSADTTATLRIVNDRKATSHYAREFLSTKQAYENLFADTIMAQGRQLLKVCNLNDYITPNIIFDATKSEQAKADIIASIPTAIGVVQKGQKVIDSGDIVSDEAYLAIESFNQENERRGLAESQKGLVLGGDAIYMLVLITCLTLYLSLFRKDYFEHTRSVAMAYVLILSFILITALLVRQDPIYAYFLPYCIVPVFIRVFLDSRTAFVIHTVMILCCAPMMLHPFSFTATQIVAGMTTIYSLRQLQNRGQLFKTAAAVLAVCMIMTLGFNLMRVSSIADLNLSSYYYILGNCGLLLFAYPLLYLVEKVFGFTSDITLIELSNTNSDLLRQLSETCPGTFQHSIQVGNLAAEIANKIGANAQMVRTGALYHDIGKLQNPVYFTENQSGMNPHDHLSAVESAQIIIGHVYDGQKLADKYNLPGVIRDFISTHHGQGKAKYFAIKYKNEHPNEYVDDLMFTYPGPNPFTREQAILMMADAVEAASRSLPEYSEQAIRDLVNRIIDGMVADRFFHECPITFRDIAYAKTVLIEKLKTIYHTRISYPKEK